MAFLSLLTRDVEVERAVRLCLQDRHVVARSGEWARLIVTLRERPATCVILDDGCVPALGRPTGSVAHLRAHFPSLPVIWLARPGADPFDLLRLGNAGVDRLLLLQVDDVAGEVQRSVARALGTGTAALVTRHLSPYLPPRSMVAVRKALDLVHRRPSADELAAAMGLSRPHLSVCLKEYGLPSTGHLLVWARLLHAGAWLSDPGRTAESVSRQLEYADGAAFRRALRNYVGGTPTEVIQAGGLACVLDSFLKACGFGGIGRNDRSAA
jgi:AraC-like DNA-binding protein